MPKTLLTAVVEIETMAWIQKVHQTSRLSWDSFIDCVLKVGVETFDVITWPSIEKLEEEEEEE
jgi:hypothetical protein